MDLCSKSGLSDLLSRHGFTFSRALGQNFLVSRAVIQRIIADSGIGQNDGILEIGPGAGCLTAALSDAAKAVVAVELDERLLPVLRETLQGRSNVTVLRDDALKHDFRQTVQTYFSGLRPSVCANLPYSVTTPLIVRLLESDCFDSLTLMVQKEVAERLTARPGDAERGAITVFTQFYTQANTLFNVPAACFWPSPKVDSAIIQLKTRSERVVSKDEEPLFFRTVRAAFSQRRKTLVNALSSGFGTLGKDKIAGVISQLGHSSLVRGERLSTEEYARLSRALAALL